MNAPARFKQLPPNPRQVALDERDMKVRHLNEMLSYAGDYLDCARILAAIPDMVGLEHVMRQHHRFTQEANRTFKEAVEIDRQIGVANE